MQKSPITYRLALCVLSPMLLGLTLWQAWKSQSKRFALQRLGFCFGTHAQQPLWIHCASVGEVNAAKPLINRLRNDPRFAPVVVSTATPTGADTVEQQGWEDVQHIFLPVDHSGAVNRAFAAVSPRALLLMETEIWPNLIHKAAAEQVPVVIFNGRLSEKTLKAPRWLLQIYQQTLPLVRSILAKSTSDAAGFAQLGAPADTVTTVGNLKFAAAEEQIEQQPNPIERPFWLAASTHEDEEVQLCRALQNAIRPNPDLLVIAPRHPKRSEKIQEQLSALGLNFAVRSKQETIDENTQVYLADTLGEMKLWLQHTRVVFMGGSLVPVGGHNILEPAAVGLPILSGPHLHNFSEEAALLQAAGAIQLFETAEQVIAEVNRLIDSPQEREARGQSGLKATQSHAKILDDYIAALLPYVSANE